MSNLELIDDYLTNRLGDAEKVAFEKQLASDPSLKADLGLQKHIVEGVKKARAAELKAMLQNVPVGGSATFNMPMLRMAAGVIGAGLLIAALSFYFNGKGSTPNMSTSLEDSIKKTDPTDFEPLEEPTTDPAQAIEKKEVKAEEQVKKKGSDVKKETVQPIQPKIEAVDPSSEMINESQNSSSIAKEKSKSAITVSHIAVEVDSSSKAYPFHYQFSKGKLMLYGSFDKTLYEILEINGENRSVFMYYKDNYYLLNEKQSSITLLEPIKDKELVAKLKEYKSK
jgi:hypothetical protein